MRIRDITDGTADTVMLVEVADAGIHWMEPRDLTFAEATVGKASSFHAGGFNTLFCDGSIHFLDNDLSTAVLHDLLTALGGETVELKQ
jgi:prepilin-type processing-associated H-X9-DG protein